MTAPTCCASGAVSLEHDTNCPGVVPPEPATTIGLDGWVNRYSICDASKARRERIATAALSGLIVAWPEQPRHELVVSALDLADRLIAELDK